MEEVILRYIPSHVGLMGNELADKMARNAAEQYSIVDQDKVCCTLSNLKCYLRNKLLQKWNENYTRRYQLIGFHYLTRQTGHTFTPWQFVKHLWASRVDT